MKRGKVQIKLWYGMKQVLLLIQPFLHNPNALSAVLNSQIFANQDSSSIMYLPNLSEITRVCTHCLSPA